MANDSMMAAIGEDNWHAFWENECMKNGLDVRKYETIDSLPEKQIEAIYREAHLRVIGSHSTQIPWAHTA